MKCKTTARMINLVFISLIAILIMVAPVLVQANSNQTVNATIKLSVCGDDIVEGSEDCEGSNLNGKACASLGYAGGDLTCDIACTFATSSCIAPTPTPTPTPTPAPEPVPTAFPDLTVFDIYSDGGKLSVKIGNKIYLPSSWQFCCRHIFGCPSFRN